LNAALGAALEREPMLDLPALLARHLQRATFHDLSLL
jgi:hypothetical protein